MDRNVGSSVSRQGGANCAPEASKPDEPRSFMKATRSSAMKEVHPVAPYHPPPRRHTPTPLPMAPMAGGRAGMLLASAARKLGIGRSDEPGLESSKKRRFLSRRSKAATTQLTSPQAGRSRPVTPRSHVTGRRTAHVTSERSSNGRQLTSSPSRKQKKLQPALDKPLPLPPAPGDSFDFANQNFSGGVPKIKDEPVAGPSRIHSSVAVDNAGQAVSTDAVKDNHLPSSADSKLAAQNGSSDSAASTTVGMRDVLGSAMPTTKGKGKRQSPNLPTTNSSNTRPSSQARKTNAPRKSRSGTLASGNSIPPRVVSSRVPGVVHRKKAPNKHPSIRKDIEKGPESPTASLSLSPKTSSPSPPDIKKPRPTRTSILRENMHVPTSKRSDLSLQCHNDEKVKNSSTDQEQKKLPGPMTRRKSLIPEKRLKSRHEAHRRLFEAGACDAGEESQGSAHASQSLEVGGQVSDQPGQSFIEGEVKERSMSEKRRTQQREKELAMQKAHLPRLHEQQTSQDPFRSNGSHSSTAVPKTTSTSSTSLDRRDIIDGDKISSVTNNGQGSEQTTYAPLSRAHSYNRPSLESSRGLEHDGPEPTETKEKVSSGIPYASSQSNLLSVHDGSTGGSDNPFALLASRLDALGSPEDLAGCFSAYARDRRVPSAYRRSQDDSQMDEKYYASKGISTVAKGSTLKIHRSAERVIMGGDPSGDSVELGRGFSGQRDLRKAITAKELQKLADKAAVRSRSNSAVDGGNAAMVQESQRPSTSQGIQSGLSGRGNISKRTHSNFTGNTWPLLERTGPAIGGNARFATSTRTEDPFVDEPNVLKGRRDATANTATEKRGQSNIMSEGAWIAQHGVEPGEPSGTTALNLVSPMSAAGDGIPSSPVSTIFSPNVSDQFLDQKQSDKGTDKAKFEGLLEPAGKENAHPNSKFPNRSSSIGPVPDFTTKRTVDFETRQRLLGESSGIHTREAQLSPNSVFDQNKVSHLAAHANVGNQSPTSPTGNTHPAKAVLDSVRGIFKRNPTAAHRPRPLVLTNAQGSPLADVSNVHPAHRPFVSSPLNNSQTVPTSPFNIPGMDVPVTPATPSAQEIEMAETIEIAKHVLKTASEHRSSPNAGDLLSLGRSLANAIERVNMATLLVEEKKREATHAVVQQLMRVRELGHAARLVQDLTGQFEREGCAAF